MKKPKNINQRLVFYCKSNRIKQVDLERLGIGSKQTINNIWHERYKPSCEFLELFIENETSINARWLMTGRGEMIEQLVKE